MKRALIFVSILTLSVSLYAQKKSALGFSFNLTDFNTPTVISKSSLGDVIKDYPWYKANKMSGGFSVYYWKGLTKKIDLSIRYNGVFTPTIDSMAGADLREYTNELEASVHAFALRPTSIVNPFITAGIGAGNYYKGKINAYAPLGVGIQFNIQQQSYIFLQANYRLSFDKETVPNMLFYSVGMAQSLKRSTPKVIPPPPPPVVVDRDGDGVVDSLDACPDVAGKAALKGCPDRDNDGIADKDDKCPDVAGTAKYEGCPIPDTDNDGINDEEDKCVTVPGVAKYNGCPIPDGDNDGVNDEVDACPTVPGPASNRGCPEIKEEIKKKIDVAANNILFATGSSKLVASSNKGLNEVAKIMQEDQSVLLTIDGHTDDVGKDEFNQTLSENRAAAVKQYLVSKGVDESRIVSAGHGETTPIADNKTAAGRKKNRRVELVLSYYR